MHIAGIALMVLAIAVFAASRLLGMGELYILRGTSLQVRFSRPVSALDSNYAVFTVRVEWLLLAIFLVGFALFIANGVSAAA
jgi:hypothetical protein